MPVIWFLARSAVVGGIGYLLTEQAEDVIEKSGEAADKSARLVKWMVIGGVVYTGYQIAKGQKVL